MASETAATLLEREGELSELGSALSAARAGRGRVVLVEGQAGLGKTSLLRAAGELAADAGFRCLRARAGELEQDFAYGCLRQLLEPVVARAPDVDLLFAGAAALARPLLTPAAVAEPEPAAGGAFPMLHGLYWLINNLADGGPIALLVDDLQWCDPESLRFLNYLTPRLDGLPVAVLASARPGERDIPDVTRLAAAPETLVLRPRPLSTEATAALCAQVLGDGVAAEFATACRTATGGNPFLLEALLREAGDKRFATDAAGARRVAGIGPAAVAQAVVLRLSGQPASATALVRATAVLGEGASLAEAAALAGLAEAEAARGADLLLSLALFRHADGLAFAHPIVRDAVYADIGALERARIHARAADILIRTGASEERVAAQIAAAEPAGDAARVDLLRRVAAAALRCGAPAAAVAWLRRALAEPPPPEVRADLLLELGSAELRLGTPDAAQHLAAAAERIRDPALLATAVRQLANALTISGRPEQAVPALEAAIDQISPQDAELGLLLEAERASHALQAGPDARTAAGRRLRRYAGLTGATPGERLVLASLACDRARASESAAEAAGVLEAALAGGRLLDEQRLEIVGTLYDVVLGLLATDALDVAEACLEPAIGDARERASVPAMAYLTDRRGWVALRRGDVARAEDDARTAVELLTANGIPLGVPYGLALLVEALIERGELAAAEGTLAEAGAASRPGPTSNFLLEAEGLLAHAQGRPDEAVEHLLEFGRRDERWGAANPLASRWRSHAALALVAAGDPGRARRLAAEDVGRAQRWGAASGIGIALRAQALAEGGDDAVDRLRAAADVLERSPARLELGRTLCDLGAALRRANRRTEARGALQAAVDLAHACGADALAERARTELRASGGRWSDPYGAAAEQLTVSERRVAELAAGGRSNPEIAQALFVTRKTVETHLGAVYRKLDIRGRGELGRALAPAAG